MALTLLVAYVALLDVDKAALRATVTLPSVSLEIGLNTSAFRQLRARTRLTELQPALLADKNNPKVLFEVATNFREAEESDSAKEYFTRTIKALSSKAERTLEENFWLAKSYVETLQFVEAKNALAPLKVEAVVAYLNADIAFSQAMSELTPDKSRIDLVQTLMDPVMAGKVDTWLKSYEAVKTLGKKSVELDPKNIEAHRLLANIYNGEAAIRFAKALAKGEQPKSPMLSDQAGIHYKECVKIAPDDSILAADLLTYKFTTEMFKNPGMASADVYSKLSKESKQLISSLELSFERLSTLKAPDSMFATESRGVSSIMRGDYDSGIAWLQKAQDLNPTERRIPLMRMDAMLLAKQYPAAGLLGVTLLKTISFTMLRLKTAKAFELAGNPERATSLILDGLLEEPLSPLMRLSRASFIIRDAESKDMSEASAIFNDLALIRQDADPDFAEDLLFYRAVFFGLIGEAVEGRRLLEALKRANPKDAKYEKARSAMGN